jgi:hypothetical protein
VRRAIIKYALFALALLISFALILVAWCGWRVTTAMNHGALTYRAAMCLDVQHLADRDADAVPQSKMDEVLTWQIVGHYYRYRKRIVPDSMVILSSQIGWRTFWSADSRRRMYKTVERRMRPCPGAMKRYRAMRDKKIGPA